MIFPAAEGIGGIVGGGCFQPLVESEGRRSPPERAAGVMGIGLRLGIQPVGAGLCPRPVCRVEGGFVGADLRVGPDTFCRGTRSRADTSVRPYAVGGVLEPRGSGVKTDLARGAGRSPPPTPSRDRWRRGAPGAWLPPAKFRSGIWGVSHGHRPLRPAGGRGTARRVVVPYGRLRRAAAIALGSGAQRSVCGGGGEEWAGIDARTIPKGGPPPAPATAALSEAESAERRVRCTAPHKERRDQSKANCPCFGTGCQKAEASSQTNGKGSLSRILRERAKRQSLSDNPQTGQHLGQSSLLQIRQAVCG